MADKRLRTMVFPGLEDTYTIPQDMNDLESIEAVAEPYDEFASYAIGDYCSNGGKFYKCNTAIPSGETWNANHWTETNVGDEILAEKAATNTALSGKVSKSGDTMSGTLRMQSSILDVDTVPSNAQYPSVEILADKNNKDYGGLYGTHLANDKLGINIGTNRTVNGTTIYNWLGLLIDPSGNPAITTAYPSAWRTALGVAQYTEGTWTPKLYDYSTYIRDLPAQKYFKIGKMYFMPIYVSPFPETTFATMIEIRNLPCDLVIAGNFYVSRATGEGGTWTIQGSGNTALFRPNFAGTLSGGIFSGMFFGYDN